MLAFVEAGVEGIVTAAGGISRDARQAAQDRGVIFVSTQRLRSGGHNLLPQKARLLLMLAMAFSDDAEQVRAWFAGLSDQEWQVLPSGALTDGGL